MIKYSYAIEKFNQAIYILATGSGDVRSRLLTAFQGPLMMIDTNHLPEKCKVDFELIKKTITKYDETYKGQKELFKTTDGHLDHYLPGKIEATLGRIRNSTGEKVAEKIYYIWSFLNNDN